MRDPNNKYLIAVDTKDTPGKVKCVSVVFVTEYLSADQFKDTEFTLLDRRLPEAQQLATVLKDE